MLGFLNMHIITSFRTSKLTIYLWILTVFARSLTLAFQNEAVSTQSSSYYPGPKVLSATGDVYAADESATQMQGTIYWMAPEAVHSPSGYSAKVDIWSLGCVWHEMCTGERPWKNRDMFYVLNQVST